MAYDEEWLSDKIWVLLQASFVEGKLRGLFTSNSCQPRTPQDNLAAREAAQTGWRIPLDFKSQDNSGS